MAAITAFFLICADAIPALTGKEQAGGTPSQTPFPPPYIQAFQTAISLL
jgi:hypothetical protein